MNEITEEIDHENTAQTTKPTAKSAGNVASLLETRQDMYTKALAGAKAGGDASKARRLDRQLKVESLQSESIDFQSLLSRSLDYSRFTQICTCRTSD